MALSDTCYEALAELGSGFKHYCHWYKKVEYVAGVIDAMFSLAVVAVKIDMIDPIVSRDINLNVSRVVLIYLLPDAEDENVERRKAIYTSLIEVAYVDKRFLRALETIEAWLHTSEGKRATETDFPEFKEVPNILEKARSSIARLSA